MHFLLIVPFLLVFSLSVIWAVKTVRLPRPRPDKLIDTTFSAADFGLKTRCSRRFPGGATTAYGAECCWFCVCLFS